MKRRGKLYKAIAARIENAEPGWVSLVPRGANFEPWLTIRNSEGQHIMKYADGLEVKSIRFTNTEAYPTVDEVAAFCKEKGYTDFFVNKDDAGFVVSSLETPVFAEGSEKEIELDGVVYTVGASFTEANEEVRGEIVQEEELVEAAFSEENKEEVEQLADTDKEDAVSAEAQFADLSAKYDALVTSITMLSDGITKLQEKFDAAEAESVKTEKFSELQTRFDEAIATFTSKFEALEADKIALQAKNEELTAEIATFSEKTQNLASNDVDVNTNVATIDKNKDKDADFKQQRFADALGIPLRPKTNY